MATIKLNSVASAHKTRNTSAGLYARYRLAKAEYERAVYAGSVAGEDCEDAILNPLSETLEEALRNLMLCSVDNLNELTRKLEAFQEEELQGHTDVAVFVSQLVFDARQLWHRRGQTGAKLSGPCGDSFSAVSR